MLSWFFSSSSLNNSEFTNAIVNNLIDTQDIINPLYRVSIRKYFDQEYYPIPKTVNSPIWFTLNVNDVISYLRQYKQIRTATFENINPQLDEYGIYYSSNSDNENDNVIVKYNLNPNYKILKLRLDNREMDKQTIKIIVEYIIDKIKNDSSKTAHLISRAKENEEIQPHLERNDDTYILNYIFNEFKGIYNDKRTAVKFIDELLFQELVEQMEILNLIERYNIVGFWNGFSYINMSDEVIPEELVIISSRMKECLSPMIRHAEPLEQNQNQNQNIKTVNISKTMDEKIAIKNKQNKSKRDQELRTRRNINGGSKYKNRKYKTKKYKTKKYKN